MLTCLYLYFVSVFVAFCNSLADNLVAAHMAGTHAHMVPQRRAAGGQHPIKDFLCICIFVFLYLCICVFVYLCICVFVYLCKCKTDGAVAEEIGAALGQHTIYLRSFCICLFASVYLCNCKTHGAATEKLRAARGQHPIQDFLWRGTKAALRPALLFFTLFHPKFLAKVPQLAAILLRQQCAPERCNVAKSRL